MEHLYHALSLKGSEITVAHAEVEILRARVIYTCKSGLNHHTQQLIAAVAA